MKLGDKVHTKNNENTPNDVLYSCLEGIYTNGKKKLCILKIYIYFFMTGYLIFLLVMTSWNIDFYAIDQ
jgi:hypothetical protein